MLTFLIGD